MSLSFQKIIREVVIKSYEVKTQSDFIYQEAEELLLTELGLKDWQLTEDNITVKSLSSSFLNSGRLDAEYYQPKYDELENELNQFPSLKIADIIKYPVSSGSTPKAGGDDYTDSINGIPFIRAVDLKDSRVETDNFIYIKPNIHQKLLKKHNLKRMMFYFQ